MPSPLSELRGGRDAGQWPKTFTILKVQLGPAAPPRRCSQQPDWPYEQHFYTNRSRVHEQAGEGLKIDTDIQDADAANPVPITTHEGEVIEVDESRSDRHDFTYAHGIPGGTTVIGCPRRSWAPWMNHTWDKSKVNCITKWNAKMGKLVVYAIAPIRAGDELLTHYGRGYWLARLHTLPSEVQREAFTAGRFSELEIFTGLEANLDVRGPALGPPPRD